MTEGVAFLLEKCKEITDKKRKLEEVFDSKEWDNDYMTRVVGGPLSIFVGKWNDTKTKADMIARVGISEGETIEHFEKRFSEAKPKKYGFFALGGEVSDELLDKAKEYNLTYETVRGNYFFKGTSKDLAAFVKEELGVEGTEEDLINQADKGFSRVRTVDSAKYERNLFGEKIELTEQLKDMGFDVSEINKDTVYKGQDGKDYKIYKVYSKDFISPYDEEGKDVKGAWSRSITLDEEDKIANLIKSDFANCKLHSFWTGSIDLFEVWVPVEDEVEIEDELIQSASKEAFEKNLKTELEAGKSKEQALAIAYATQRKNAKDELTCGVEYKDKDNMTYFFKDMLSSKGEADNAIAVDFEDCESCFDWARDEDKHYFINNFDEALCKEKLEVLYFIGDAKVDRDKYLELTGETEKELELIENNAIGFAIDMYYEDTMNYGPETNLNDSFDLDKELIERMVAYGSCDTKEQAKELVSSMSKETKMDFLKSYDAKAKESFLEDENDKEIETIKVVCHYIESKLLANKYLNVFEKGVNCLGICFDPSLVKEARESMKPVLADANIDLIVHMYDEDEITVSITCDDQEWCPDLVIKGFQELGKLSKYLDDNLGEEVLLDNAKNNDTFENKA